MSFETKVSSDDGCCRDIFIEFTKNLEKKNIDKNRYGDNILTGFSELDQALNGFMLGEIVTLASRPGMGQTTFLANIMSTVAEKHPCIFITYQNQELVLQKIIAHRTQIPVKTLLLGTLRENHWGKIASFAEQLSTQSITINSPQFVKTTDKPVVVFVDDFPFSRLTIHQLRTLYPKALIFLGSAVSENIDNRPNKRPMLKDLWKMEEPLDYISDHVLFLYRDEIYNTCTEDKGIAELIIAKSNRYSTDTIRLAFISECQLFANLPRT